MVRINGNLWRRNAFLSNAPFNAVLDVSLSDANPVNGGSAQILNTTESGVSFQDDRLIGAVIYLLFGDGPNFVQVDDIDDLDSSRKQFYFDSATGTVTFSYEIIDPIDITIFYASSGTTGVAPTEPVTLAEAKDYMKISPGITEDDDLIEELITTAREQCEDYSGISIVNRTVTAILNNSCGGIFLPYGPVIDITTVSDDEGDEIETDNYEVTGENFLQLRSPTDDWIKLVYTAGYGIPPKRIKTAILQQVFYLYQHRGEEDVDMTLSSQAKSTLSRIRRVG